MSTAAFAANSSARTQPRPRGELTIEHRAKLALSAEDAAAVEMLADARPHVGVFLSSAWLSGFFAEPPAGYDPSVLILREAGALRGFVPLAIRHTPTHSRVSLLGGGMGSDRVDLLAARGYESVCADALMAWLRGEFPRGFVLELRDVPGDSSLWGSIGRAVIDTPARVEFVPREVYAQPYLPLHETSTTIPGDGLEPSDAASLARHRRWLERRCHLRIETLTDVEDVQQTFDVLVGLLRSRWGSSRSALEDPRVQRFHRRVLPLLLRDGRLRMVRLVGGMRTIAVFYGVASRSGDVSSHRAPSAPRWWGYYLAGYDREWARRIHLGRIALAAGIDLASKEGAREFDFLKGPERVKYIWPVRERVTIDADVYSRDRGPRLVCAARAARLALAALARAFRDPS
jgi:CelD/BcsL family acetyltransferase involved in cellulose biosynthesis